MIKVCHTGLIVLAYVFLVGMGGFAGTAPIKVPEPPMNYNATITDQSDVSTQIERFSFEGYTAISGKLGSGEVSIDFDKIASVRFILKDESLHAEVSLKDGEKISLILEKGAVCYGKLPYGELRIAAEDIRFIAIHGQVAKGAVAGN